MAFDEQLADRVRDVLGVRPGFTERRMFGGIAFMLDGHMCAGVLGDELLIRHDPELRDQLLARDGVREFDFTGRPMRGFLVVAPDETGSDEQLRDWVDEAAAWVATLPPKA